MRRFFIVGATALFLSGCQRHAATETFEYKIESDGAPVVSDRDTYETLGEQTFIKTQKYRIVARGDDAKVFHLLLVNITQKIGDKVVESAPAFAIPIRDGLHVYDCQHRYFDVDLKTSPDQTDSPTCQFDPVGVMIPNASARLAK